MNKPSASSRFNFANLLTFARIVAIPLILLYLWIDSETSRTIALVIYVFLCATDFLDGYLARLFKYNSILGEILDPIADKLLIVAVLVMLVMVDRVGGVHNIAVLLILMREILISRFAGIYGAWRHKTSGDCQCKVENCASDDGVGIFNRWSQWRCDFFRRFLDRDRWIMACRDLDGVYGLSLFCQGADPD